MNASSRFTKSHRITKKADFLRLRKDASKMVARHWILFFIKHENEMPRLAVTISARYGNAVKRNKFRRWLRERFRTHKKEFSGLDLHFVAKQKPMHLAEARYKEELHEDYQRLLARFR